MLTKIKNLRDGDVYTLPIGTVQIIDRDRTDSQRFRALLNGEPTYVQASNEMVEVIR